MSIRFAAANLPRSLTNVVVLPFIEAAHAGALDCRNMDEHVIHAVVRLNEAKTSL
jgi:hypothetical protein